MTGLASRRRHISSTWARALASSARVDGQPDALADPDVAHVAIAEGGERPLDHAALGVEDARPVPDLDAGLIVLQSSTPYQSSKLVSVSCS